MSIRKLLYAALLFIATFTPALAQQENALGAYDKNGYSQFFNNNNCLTITGITNANPGVVTTNYPHNLNSSGTTSVTIAGVTGMSGVNGTVTATYVSPTTFSIGINTTSSGAYTGGGYFPNPNATPTSWNPTSCPLSTLWDYTNNVPFGTASDPMSAINPGFAMSHASTTAATGTSLVAKSSAGSLYGFNCSAVAGGSAGYCIVYNGSSAPSTGSLTGANVLDFCYFDSTARGCSLSRIPNYIAYSTGIVVLVSSASTPYTYTTGTDTAAITVDYK